MPVDVLEAEVTAKRHAVAEFRFLAEEGARLGVRVYAFGGLATSFGAYRRWDLMRRGGDKRILAGPERFDDDLDNFVRLSQDMDIVVDGTPQQAEKLKEALLQRFPYFDQLPGGRSVSRWEVRCLRHATGGGNAAKDALVGPDGLAEKNFRLAHTDSASTGMIELTEPSPGTSAVRDLMYWNVPDLKSLKDPQSRNFLADLAHGKVSAHFSDRHHEVDRFNEGKSPPMTAVIRTLTKAFEYNASIDPGDMARMQAIFDEFDPKKDLRDDYALKRFIYLSKKMLERSLNRERTYKILDQMRDKSGRSLREALMQVDSRDLQVGSLNWMLKRDPLPWFKLTPEPGKKTAADLGISEISHETAMQVAQDVTWSPDGRPNFLMSKDGEEGGRATYGDGVYFVKGRKAGSSGARQSGQSVIYRLRPEAVLDRDFSVEGSIIVVKNGAAIEEVSKPLRSLSPSDYFKQVLEGRDPLKEWPRAAKSNFLRKLPLKISGLKHEELDGLAKEVESIFGRKELMHSSAVELLDLWFASPVSVRYPRLMVRLIQRGRSGGDLAQSLYGALEQAAWAGTPLVERFVNRAASQSREAGRVIGLLGSHEFTRRNPKSLVWLKTVLPKLTASYLRREAGHAIANPDLIEGAAQLPEVRAYLSAAVSDPENPFYFEDSLLRAPNVKALFPEARKWASAHVERLRRNSGGEGADEKLSFLRLPHWAGDALSYQVLKSLLVDSYGWPVTSAALQVLGSSEYAYRAETAKLLEKILSSDEELLRLDPIFFSRDFAKSSKGVEVFKAYLSKVNPQDIGHSLSEALSLPEWANGPESEQLIDAVLQRGPYFASILFMDRRSPFRRAAWPKHPKALNWLEQAVEQIGSVEKASTAEFLARQISIALSEPFWSGRPELKALCPDGVSYECLADAIRSGKRLSSPAIPTSALLEERRKAIIDAMEEEQSKGGCPK